MNLQCEQMLPVHNLKAELGQSEPSQHKILRAIETFSIGFIHLDFNWKIRYWNLAAEKLTGYRQEQILNKNLFDVITEINHIEFYKTWQNTLKSKKVIQFNDYFWPTQKWFEFYLYAAGEDIIVHFQDITKKFATRKRLTKKINQLKEVSLFNSHAIRRPLANLIGLTDLLNEEIKLNDLKEYLFYIRESVKNLDEIISKINTIANEKTDNDDLSSLEHFQFKNLLEEIKGEIAKESQKHQIAINCSNVLFYGNRQGIKSCIKILALNAIKHSTSRHEIKISIRVKGSNLHVQVRDFGKGMSKEVLADIHSTLTSATLTNNKLSGSRKKIAKISRVSIQHNGSFWIDSQIDKGTNCLMLLPLSNFSIFKPGYEKRLLTNTNNEVKIHFDAIDQCLHVKWVGYFDSANVKKSYYKIYEAMKNYQCLKVISNETQTIGAGINCIKWLVKYGFPLLFKAGLSHFAWVSSKNEFAKLSTILVSNSLNMPSVIKTFSEPRPALKWINEKNKTNAK